MRIFIALLLSCLTLSAATNVVPSARILSMNVTNGYVGLGTNKADVLFMQDEEVFGIHTNRFHMPQPIYFPNSAAYTITTLGTEKLANTGFELLSGHIPTNWNPTVNFGDFGTNTTAHAGTNGFTMTNSTVPALSFGGGDYVDCGADSTGNRTEWTFEFWLYLDQDPTNNSYIVVRENTGTYWLGVYVTSSRVLYYHQKTAGNNITLSGPTIPLHQWMHVACVKSPPASTVNWYINGVLVSSNYSSTWDTIYTAAFGWRLGDATNKVGSFVGKLSDVRLWSTNRTAAEVLANYRNRLAGSEAWLAHYWKLDEGTGTTIDDEVSAMSDGTFAGGANAPSWASVSSAVYSDSVAVTAGTNMQLTVWYYGDGSNLGRYGVYDPVNEQWILSMRDVPGSAASWATVSATVTVPTNSTYAQVVLSGPASGYATFDDISLKNATTVENPYATMLGAFARCGDEIWWSGEELLQASMTGILFTNWTGYGLGVIDGYMNGGNATNLSSVTTASLIATNATIYGGSLTNISGIYGTNGSFVNLVGLAGILTNFTAISATDFYGRFNGDYVLSESNAPGASYYVAWIPRVGLRYSTNEYWNIPFKYDSGNLSIAGLRNVFLDVGDYNTSVGYGTTTPMGDGNIIIGKSAGLVSISTMKAIQSQTTNITYALQATNAIDDFGFDVNGVTWNGSAWVGYIIASPITFDFWYKHSTNDVTQRIFEIDGTNVNGDIFLDVTGNEGHYVHGADAAVPADVTFTIPTNGWTHITLAHWTNGMNYVYTNGVAAGGSLLWGSAREPSSTVTFTIGKNMAGSIANFRIWTNTLPTGDIFKMMHFDDQSYHHWKIETNGDDSGNSTNQVDLTKNSDSDVTYTSSGIPPFFESDSSSRDDIGCGFIGDNAKKGTSSTLTNAWAFGKDATVSANNTFSFSGYLLPSLGYKSTDATSGGTSNIVIWSNDGTNPAVKITIIYKNGLYAGHTEE